MSTITQLSRPVGIGSIGFNLFSAVYTFIQRRRTARMLNALDDLALSDIGIDRSDIQRIASGTL